jgi:hypothetical protein
VFNFETLKLMEQIDTYSNPLGLTGICTADKPIQKTIACLGTEKGHLKVLNYGKLISNKYNKIISWR